MKKIELTKGYSALVDDEDYPFLNRYKWSLKTGRGKLYAASRINGRETLMHRFILNPRNQVDHINGDGLDNQKANLRHCNKYQNMANTKKRKDNISGYKGVCQYRGMAKWRAYIQINKQWKHLGYFNSPLEAALAYNNAANKYFGEFAWLNQI